MKLPKSSAMLLLATGQFVFDIFSAGLSSPAGMMMSGIYIVKDHVNFTFNFFRLFISPCDENRFLSNFHYFFSIFLFIYLNF